MPTVFIKDDLRAATEAATGGLVSVHYTASGQPSFMRWIPKFNLEDLGADYGTGVHPAFIVDGVTKDGIWIGVYPGVIRNGELISVPGVVPSVSQPYTSFVTAARAAGPGFHVMTNAEWAAVALLTAKTGVQPRGNTSYGRAHNATWETATRADRGTPGTTSGDAKHVSGSGPVTWRHDGTPAGIADLVGNIWEFTPGVRLVDGEIQVLANNNAASAALFDDSAAWQAISASNGALVAPGTAGTLKYDSLAAYSDNGTVNDLGNFQIDDVVDYRNGPAGDNSSSYDYNSISFSSLAADTGITVPAILRALCLAPGSLSLNGRIYMRNHGQRYPLRGGSWYNGAHAGLGAIDLNHPASNADWNIGARPAKV
ncbi:hypothetical protein [Pelomicrobium methylotrophicum]|uniref:Sulfatase-modifying factor enzyme domain-containing protein n=1 Tax=Pelomicrobium methylotrophicum TaxID=2602750 RepID=A0A5C7ETE7_9PROT|nr:hypothetical protein [Pelomicrobium methylotrophicum]TXF11945.1 hypothetical protein FR698_08050 [Pelomicrobium methylotrophicum]